MPMSMTIQSRPMGAYQTNCYVLTKAGKSLIIDPGVDALAWVQASVAEPVAILNTHGHFDHVWSNKAVKEALDVPIYTPEKDCFMLENDPFGQGTPSSRADVAVKDEKPFELGGFSIRFVHLPGHTPGTSVIVIDEAAMFSGDFVFEGSIGRFDFPYSEARQMKESIEKFMRMFTVEMPIYPGHGSATSVSAAKRMLPGWIRHIQMGY